MREKLYFVVNDTRYDNHHGCLTVIKNLHNAMNSRNWQCCGSLPVSSKVSDLKKYKHALLKADLVIVNGEGSLHHDSRNANRLYEICKKLISSKPLVLLNALWQENDLGKWSSLLAQCQAVYVRDKQSLNALLSASIKASYAPDLTFYDYPAPLQKSSHLSRYAITDSVINKWTDKALSYAAENENLDFITMFTGQLEYKRGLKGALKSLKYKVYPCLSRMPHIHVPPRYRSIEFAVADSNDFIQHLTNYRAICVARYHALCFVVQQEIPFVAVSSNSYKSEALIDEIGLPKALFLMPIDGREIITEKLNYIAKNYDDFRGRIIAFKEQAKRDINAMFDEITS